MSSAVATKSRPAAKPRPITRSRPSGSLLAELEYIPEEEAADVLGLTPKTLSDYRKNGCGPSHSIVKRRIFYRRDALVDWLKNGGAKDV
jgi:hypothetical protein